MVGGYMLYDAYSWVRSIRGDGPAASTGTVTIELDVSFEGRPFDGSLYVRVHDLTFKQYRSRVLFSGEVEIDDGRGLLPVKVSRVPLAEICGPGGSACKVSYKLVELLVVVTGGGFFGARNMLIEPSSPVMNVKIDVDLVRLERAEHGPLYRGGHAVQGGMYHVYEWLRSGELHGVVGLRVRWRVYTIETNTVLYYDRYVRYFVASHVEGASYDSGWRRAGKSLAESLVEMYAEISGGGWVQRMVEARVRYRVEEWVFQQETQVEYYYIMAPEYIFGVRLGGHVYGDDECGYPAPNNASRHHRGGGNTFIIRFESDWRDDTPWLATDVSFTIPASWGQLSFSGTINLYRAAGTDGVTGTPPAIEVEVVNWASETLYWWYGNGNDPTSYIAHFSWRG